LAAPNATENGQPDDEAGPAAELVESGDAAAVALDDPLRHHQAQAHPRVLARRERLEQAGEDLGGNPGPRVGDG
jgi:hypothetical protein